MKYLQHAAHPMVMSLLIGAFAYLLFFSPAGQGLMKAKEREQETENLRPVPQPDPNLTVTAAPQGQAPAIRPEVISPEEVPFDPANPQNQLNQWGQPQAGQADSQLVQQGQQILWNNPTGGDSPFNPRNEQRILQKWSGSGQDTAYAPVGQFQDPNVVRPVLNNGVAPTAPIPVPDKVLQEGHWIGLEAIPITPALARANNIPPNVSGVLIDEVTLLSAEVGLLAGDVITSLNGQPVADLNTFKQATRQVAMSKQATVVVFRGGSNRQVAIHSTEELGIAQFESAPMILSGARAPHGYYGPCDRCHSIAKTTTNMNSLKMDNGDNLTKVAPAIHRGATPPHRDRGECINCHTVM